MGQNTCKMLNFAFFAFKGKGEICMIIVAARDPCDVFDPWVRWERGQVGI